MKKNVILYFAIFGFFFGILNTLDTSGGDIPYSMMLNLPTVYTQGIVNNVLNEIESARVNSLGKGGAFSTPERSLSRDEFEKLTPKEQAEFISKMTLQKNLARDDFLIGERSIIHTLRGIVSFTPIISAVSWAIIGSIFYLIARFFKSTRPNF